MSRSTACDYLLACQVAVHADCRYLCKTSLVQLSCASSVMQLQVETLMPPLIASVLRRHVPLAAVSKQRLYSTTIETVPLAFTRHDSPTSTTSKNPPLVILHGLFGSKQNNRSISK